MLPPATKHVPGLDNWVASIACPQRCPLQDAHFKEAVAEAAALHSRDELFAKHIEPEPAPEDPLDWAMEEASDDEDDAPMPDAPPEPERHAAGVRTPDVPLGALHRSAPGGDQEKKLPLHHITSSLCCLTCPLSRVSCVVSVGVLPRLPDSDKKVSFFFSRWPQKSVDTRWCYECHSDVNLNKRGCGSPAQAQASARVDVPTARVFPVWTKESNTCASFVANAWICAQSTTDRDLESFNVNAWICAQ